MRVESRRLVGALVALAGTGCSDATGAGGGQASGIGKITHVVIITQENRMGGLYDHVPPLTVDPNGYAPRPPGLVIRPFAKAGYVDEPLAPHS